MFAVNDPFGIRKAVHPLFLADLAKHDQQGCGTSLSLDPWGNFLTAEHVIDACRVWLPSHHAYVALLSMGVVFGTVGVRPEGIATIVGASTPTIPDEDPMAASFPLDIAFLQASEMPPRAAAGTLPLRVRGASLHIGDTVVALGFPYVDTIRGSPEAARRTINEGGMLAAFGTITDFHPQGRGRLNPTPVFEVEANWPSGMSGGPVLNMQGEVIGLVSRSIDRESADSVGTGWAIWFEAIRQIPIWAPSVDPDNPRWRKG